MLSHVASIKRLRKIMLLTTFRSVSALGCLLLLTLILILNLNTSDKYFRNQTYRKESAIEQSVNIFSEPKTASKLNQQDSFKSPYSMMKISQRIQRTRQHSIEKYCKEREQASHGPAPKFYVDERHKLLYCNVPKAASTNLKRLMLIFSGHVDPKDYYSVSRYMVHFNNSMPRVEAKNAEELTELGLGDYTKFLFTRHPFERLVSAYYDKFTNKNRTEVIPFAPDPLSNLSENDKSKTKKNKTQKKVTIESFPLKYGTKIIKKYRPNASERSLKEGHDVSVPEFVSYVIDEWAQRDQIPINEHWRSTFDLCHPCSIHYDIIGKLETMQEDVNFLLEKLNETEISQLFHEYKPYATSSLVNKFMEQISNRQWEDLIRIYEKDFDVFGYEPEMY